MPTYTYHCNQCGEFDIFQSIHADRFKKCPKCHSGTVKKLIGKVNFFLKGDHWPSKVIKANDTAECERALEKEENVLLSKGHKVYPKGHPQEGCLI